MIFSSNAPGCLRVVTSLRTGSISPIPPPNDCLMHGTDMLTLYTTLVCACSKHQNLRRLSDPEPTRPIIIRDNLMVLEVRDSTDNGGITIAAVMDVLCQDIFWLSAGMCNRTLAQ